MKITVTILLFISIVVGSGSCFAQSALLDLSIERVDQPILLAYNELVGTKVSIHVIAKSFKGGDAIVSSEGRIDGTISSRAVGSNLEVLHKFSYTIFSSVKAAPELGKGQSMCLLHRTGEVVNCVGTDQSGFGYFLYNQHGYKTGDFIKWTGLSVGGVAQSIFGRVLGKASFFNRQVIVVDLSDNNTVDFTLAGHAYLDIASGFPIELRILVDETRKESLGISGGIIEIIYVMQP